MTRPRSRRARCATPRRWRAARRSRKLSDIYTVPRPGPNLKAGLAEALAKGKVDDWLSSLAPQDDTYRALSKAYLALRKAGDAPAAAIPDAGKPLEPRRAAIRASRRSRGSSSHPTISSDARHKARPTARRW